MGDDAAPTVFEQPVWYEPLRSPSWLVPPTDPSAPRVAFVGASQPPGEEADARELREGLPLALAEALRFTTAARTVASVDPDADLGDVTVRATVVLEGDDGDRALTVRLEAPDVELEPVRRPAGDATQLEEALGAVPGAVTAALRPAGIRSVWSTVYQPPGVGHAADAVRALSISRSLRDSASHRDVAGDSEATSVRRAKLDSAFRRLADLAGRATSPLASMPFFAALASSHDAQNHAYLGFRLSANGRCTTATDPRDPVFRMSVLVFLLLGDPVIAGQRAKALASSEDPELRQWLARIEGVEALRR